MCIDFFQLITKFNLILIHSQFLFISFKYYLNCSCLQFDSFEGKVSQKSYLLTIHVLILIPMFPFFDLEDNFKLSQLNSILIYSTGSCFTLKIFNYSPLKSIKLKVNHRDCIENSNSWITSFDYYIKEGAIILIWIDSRKDAIESGTLSIQDGSLINVTQLKLAENTFGQFARSLVIDLVKPMAFISLPKLNRIDSLNLHTLKRSTVVEGIQDLGQIVIDTKQQIYWIELSKCIWRLNENKIKQKLHCEPNDLISTLYLNINYNSLFWFTNYGKIEQMNLINGQHNLITDNLLKNDKYSEASFYSLKMITFEDQFIFLSSDTKHQLLRLTSSQFKSHISDSFVLLADFPNIYDFILIKADFKNSSNEALTLSDPISSQDNSTQPLSNSIINIFNSFGNEESNLFWILYIVVILVLIPVFLITLGLLIAKRRRHHQPLFDSKECLNENLVKK